MVNNTPKGLELNFSFCLGWYQNKTNDDGLLCRQGDNKTSVLFLMDLLFRAKGSHMLLDPCLMSRHTRTPRHRAYAQRHAFRLANCTSRETGLKAIRGALRIQQRHAQTQVVAPRGFPSPRASTCVLFSSASPGERADREEHRPSADADSVPRGPSRRNLEHLW